MRDKIKVLNLQFEAVIGDKEKNLKRVAKLLKKNKDFKPDLVILPEVWNIGADYKNFQKEAELIPDITTMLLSGLAQEYNTNIIAGSIIEKTFENKYYNTSLVFDRTGAFVAKYRKKHLFNHCGSKEAEYLEKGDEVCVVELDGIKFGIALCYDIRFPEQFREMVKQGAEVFIIPAAFPQERIKQWKILNKARALENLSFVISSNQYGNSYVVSPYGKILEQLDKGEDVIKYILDIKVVDEARKNCPFLEDMQ